ncbi:MAG: hypothetical protein ABJD11_00790 [Gemmatimonadota bacterium]
MSNPVDTLLESFLREADTAGVGGFAVVLYGSAVRGNWIAGHSDVNLMLVLDYLTPDTLRGLGPAFKILSAGKQQPPLVMSMSEWSCSADAFPIEISDMKDAYRVLRGSDPLLGLRVKPADLRRALEREFRGKLMRLRQAYVVAAGKPAELGKFAGQSVSSIVLLLRAVLTLKGEKPPRDPVSLISTAAELVGFKSANLLRVYEHRADSAWKCTNEEYEAYLEVAEVATRFVDQFQTGEK